MTQRIKRKAPASVTAPATNAARSTRASRPSIGISLERFCIRISPIHDPPFLHPEFDAAQGRDVRDGIAIEEHKVGE